MTTLVPERAYRAAYKAQQATFLFQCLAAHQLLRTVTGFRMMPEPSAVNEVRKRYQELIERDLRHVEQGDYPRSLLFQVPITDYMKCFPRLVRDFPRAIRRAKKRDYQDLPGSVPLDQFPPYFRRNFHWQTDGYFSRRSAEIYDVGVEFLFLGMADVMRRQIIPPVSRLLGNSPGRVLNVACGTGRTLLQMATSLPQAKLYGMDLSPYYLQVARKLLRDVANASLVAENAEHMPFCDGYFDAVTSVYLFHELPRNARRNVFREMYRVLRPGGIVVIEDSAQHGEAGEVTFFLEQFADEFHEPFYRDYLRDDLAAALGEVGFHVTSSEACFVAKVVVGKKPEASA